MRVERPPSLPIHIAAAALLALGACSSTSSGGTECNSLVDDGPMVKVTEAAAAAPTPAGGTIADGTYQLTALTAYLGVGGSAVALMLTASEVQTISGTTIEEAGIIDGQESRYTTTFATSGASLTTNDTCPLQHTATHGYTASTTGLRIYDAMGSFTLEQVYTLR